MNLFLILIPQSLNAQFLNLAPYGHYDEDGVQKSDLVFRSNNEVCIKNLLSIYCNRRGGAVERYHDALAFIKLL